jgi:hypothetical protein
VWLSGVTARFRGLAIRNIFAPEQKGLVLFILLVSLTIDFSTDTPYIPGKWLGPFYSLWPASQLTSAACAVFLSLLACLPIARVASALRPGASSSLQNAVVPVAVRILPLLAMLFVFFWSMPHVAPGLVIPWNILIFTASLSIVFLAVRRGPPVRIAAVAVVVGIAVRLVHFSRFPVDVGGDMLPLTRSALDSLWAGRSPYAYHKVPELLPLTYYPLTWLAYLPAYLAHIDLRWTNLAAELAVPAAVVYAGRGTPQARGGTFDAPSGTALLLWSFVFLLPSSVFFDRITTAPVAWALLAWTMAAAVRGARWDWLLAGLLAAATPLAALPAPFIALTWRRRLSWRRTLGRLALGVAVAAICIVPFYLWSPRGFIDGAVLWFNDLKRFPGTKWIAHQTWQRYVGFGGLFWRLGLQKWLAVIQWSLVFAMAALFLRRGSHRHLLPGHVASAFIAFMVFNSVHWPYFYQPALVCGLMALASAVPPLKV